MYICADCGRLYDEMPTHTERHDDYYSEPVNSGCYCGGDIEEAVRCSVCGEYHSADMLTEKVCDYCLHSNMKPKQLEGFIDGFETEKISFELNGILDYVFTSDEVNEILLRELKETLYNKKIMPPKLEHHIKNELQDDWAAFLAETQGEY